MPTQRISSDLADGGARKGRDDDLARCEDRTELGADELPELFERGDAIWRRLDVGDDPFTPFEVGSTEDGHLGDRRVRAQDRFDRGRVDRLAARRYHLGHPPEHLETPVVGEPAGVARSEPAVIVLRVLAPAVAAKKHRGAQFNLVVVPDADLDAVEWPPVVNDAASRFGHAVGGDGVRWAAFWHRTSA